MNRLTTKKTSTKKKSKKFYRIDEFELNDGDILVYRTNKTQKILENLKETLQDHPLSEDYLTED